MSFPVATLMKNGDQFAVRTSTQGPAFLPGTLGALPDGRMFRYGRMGAVAGVISKLYQGPVPVTNHVLQTAAATAVGATTIALTLGNTAASANDYINGSVVVDLVGNTGFGYQYTIGAHPAVAANGVFTIPLAGSASQTPQSDGLIVPGNESVQVAIATTANSVSIYPNLYYKTIVSPASAATADIAGVPAAAIAANGWGWFQTHGPCMCLTDGTVVIGQMVAASQSVAGAVTPLSTTIATTVTQVIVGRVIRVAVTTSYSTIFLQID